jgi:hypothetical protein
MPLAWIAAGNHCGRGGFETAWIFEGGRGCKRQRLPADADDDQSDEQNHETATQTKDNGHRAVLPALIEELG